MRPMDFYDKNNTSLQNINDQYYWGENIIVAPVVTENQRSRAVKFPAGKWLDFDNLTLYNGGQTYTLAAPLNKLPLFVKAGVFLPMAMPMYSLDNFHPDSLWVKYFADPSVNSTEYTFFEDNGENPNSLSNNQYILITLRGELNSEQSTIQITSTGNGYTGMPTKRQFYFELPRIASLPTSLQYNGSDLQSFETYNLWRDAKSPGYFYDSNKRTLYMHVEWNQNTTGQIVLGSQLIINSIAEEQKSISISQLYPNPASKYIELEWTSNKYSMAYISIYNKTGQIMKTIPQITITEGINRLNIDIDTLQPDLYIIEITSPLGIDRQKFIKQD
jgi:hypothetical protein